MGFTFDDNSSEERGGGTYPFLAIHTSSVFCQLKITIAKQWTWWLWRPLMIIDLQYIHSTNFLRQWKRNASFCMKGTEWTILIITITFTTKIFSKWSILSICNGWEWHEGRPKLIYITGITLFVPNLWHRGELLTAFRRHIRTMDWLCMTLSEWLLLCFCLASLFSDHLWMNIVLSSVVNAVVSKWHTKNEFERGISSHPYLLPC